MFLHSLWFIAMLMRTILSVKLAQYMYFLHQLGEFRTQNLKRMHVETLCIPIWITPFQYCLWHNCTNTKISYVWWEKEINLLTKCHLLQSGGSSEPSSQSGLESHFHRNGMQCPFSHLNWWGPQRSAEINNVA
jgi:hypothetical protein